MSAELKNLKVINGNTLIGNFSISPDVPNKLVFPPKISDLNCCIFFSDFYNDYSTIQFLCGKAPITKNTNYHFYGTTGNCISKLSGDRKNNNFGTIRPKNIEWKFISDLKFTKVPEFKSFFVFNKYPGLLELTDDDNKRTFMLHDLTKFHIDDDNEVFCFVSKSIYDFYLNLSVEFPFKKYKVIDDKYVLSNVIETLMGKTVSSGKPFANGNIKCYTKNGLDNLNNTLHAQYINSIVDFQALRNGVVEYTATSNIEDGEFVIFYQYAIDKILLDGKQIEYENIIDSNNDVVVSKITNMFVDLENIKYNGSKFISDEINARKTHYYKYTKSSDILNFNNTVYSSSIIQNAGMLLLKNIRSELRNLEDVDDLSKFDIPKPPILGRAISDGQYIRNDFGKLYSTCFENY